MKSKPDFIIIGSMKSGSTSLSDYLSAHHDIFITSPKEPQFFSKEENYDKGMGWYTNLFKDAKSHQIAGEASTCYTRWPFYPHVADRIAKDLPEVKLIYILRDPTERAYSHYKHCMEERFTKNQKIIPFSQAIEEDPEILETGLYLKQLSKYLEHFEIKNIHLVFFEELRDKPEITLPKLFKFLGVNPKIHSISQAKSNESGSSIAYHDTTKKLRNFRKLPIISSLLDTIPADLRRKTFRKLRHWIMLKAPKKDLSSTFRTQLSPYNINQKEKVKAYYSQPNKELAKFLGKDIKCLDWK